MERFLVSSASNGIHAIRNEILYLFEHYSGETHDLNAAGWDGSRESLPTEEAYQLDDFPSLVSRIDFIKADNLHDLFYYEGVAHMDEMYGHILEEIGKTKKRDLLPFINIRDFRGYMVFPVKKEPAGDLAGFMIVLLDIRPAVEEYLPSRLLEELENIGAGEDRPGKSEDFAVNLKEGRDFHEGEADEGVFIDLNGSFNLFKVRDYYYTRPDSFLPMPRAATITDNLTYLTVHYTGGEGAIVRRKIRSYGLLLLLYIVLVSALLLFLYSVYRTRQQYQREQQFTSLISHELKTPLSVIQLASESLAGGYIRSREEVADYGSMINEETGRLGRMIENILLISTLSWTGEKTRGVLIDDIFEELHRNNRSLIATRRIDWVGVNRCGGGPVPLRASLVTAALQNLVHNGIVYGADRSEDRRLTVKAEFLERKKRPGILFSVIDHGPGISRNESSHIFSDFFRGEEIRKKQMPGSGMGLALSGE